MKIWVTRTEPGASATAARLRHLGHEAIVEPVLVTVPLAGAKIDLSRAGAIAFTSRNAVTAFADLSLRRDLPVFATGEATAAAARAIGFAKVASADGGVAELAELILKERPGAEVVWPGPTEPAGDLAALLTAGGIAASLQPVYQSVEAATPPPKGIEAILVHSPKGARAVAKILEPGRAGDLTVFAISPAAAAPLRRLPFARVAVAPRPNETALLAVIAG